MQNQRGYCMVISKTHRLKRNTLMNGTIRPQTLRLNNTRLDVQTEQCTMFKQSQVYLQLVSEGEDYVKFFTVLSQSCAKI